ncbi:hypothetical protein TNCV_708441 [Trichonephila clavipes]|nr:hypothetical protein TNCV_708441 [Trichonephila clavipes]
MSSAFAWGTPNNRHATSPLVRLVEGEERLVEGEERLEASDQPQGALTLNWGETEPKSVLLPVWCSELQVYFLL